jgi:copper chaperone CopZ
VPYKPCVTKVVINSLKHRAIVDYDPAQVNPNQMLEAVEEAGLVAQAVWELPGMRRSA